MIRSTHTYVELEISPAAYDEISSKLKAAGYDHCFDSGTGAIDMHGLAITKEKQVVKRLVKVAWIPDLEEYREIFECEHGLYYCLDPGDGLPTHINKGDGIEVKEMTEEELRAL